MDESMAKGDQESGREGAKERPEYWSKFGIVGAPQAILYYSSFVVFSLFMFRNSSPGTTVMPKSG